MAIAPKKIVLKGLNPAGTPHVKRINDSGWNQYVKQFTLEHPGITWKDAMVLAKPSWAALKGVSVDSIPDISPSELEEIPNVSLPENLNEENYNTRNELDLLREIANDVSEIKMRLGGSLIRSSPSVNISSVPKISRGPSEWTQYVMQVRAETGLKMAEAMAEAKRRKNAGLWSPSAGGAAAGAGGAAEAEGGRRRKRKTRKGKKRSYRKRK